jgi:predicted XRE-type DNA-binding protein
MSEEAKKVSLLNKTEKRAIVLKALNDAGFNDNQAAGLMEVSRQRVSVVQKGIKKGTLNPYVTKAKKAVKAILEGQLVGQAESIKTADILNAAKMVLDRADPVVQKLEQSHLHLNVEIKDEDRDRYRKALGVAIEAEFEVIPEVKQICSEPESSAKSSSSLESSLLQASAKEMNYPGPGTRKFETLQPIIPMPQKDGTSLKPPDTQLGESIKPVNG